MRENLRDFLKRQLSSVYRGTARAKKRWRARRERGLPASRLSIDGKARESRSVSRRLPGRNSALQTNLVQIFSISLLYKNV